MLQNTIGFFFQIKNQDIIRIYIVDHTIIKGMNSAKGAAV